MTKIYVVTEGEYSDYRIRAIFSTDEKAREFISKQEYPNGFQLETYELDEWQHAVVESIWSCMIWLEDGTCQPQYGSDDRLVQHAKWSTVYITGHWAHAESSVSQEHANKLAVEARQKWLREKGKPDGYSDSSSEPH